MGRQKNLEIVNIDFRASHVRFSIRALEGLQICNHVKRDGLWKVHAGVCACRSEGWFVNSKVALKAALQHGPMSKDLVVFDEVPGFGKIETVRSRLASVTHFGRRVLFADDFIHCLSETDWHHVLDDLREASYALFAVDPMSGDWQVAEDGNGRLRLGRDLNLYGVPSRRALRVACILHSGGLGGAERSHTEFVTRLMGHGMLAHSWLPESGFGLGEELSRRMSPWTKISVGPSWLAPRESSVFTADVRNRLLAEAEALATQMDDVGCDVVVTQTIVNPVGAIAAALINKPHIWWVREYGDLDHGLHLPDSSRSVGAAIEKLSNHILVNSHAIRDYFFDSSSTRCSVIEPTPEALATTRLLHTRDSSWRFGVIGSLVPGKGQVDALGALFLLRQQGLDVSLSLVGSGTAADEERLRKIATFLKVDEFVHMRATSEHREEAFLGLNAVAVTSRHEAFGRVAIEAIEAGIPTVAARTAGFLEIFSGDCKISTYVPGKVGDLASSLKRIMTNEHAAVVNAEPCRRQIQMRRAFLESEHQVEDILLSVVAEGPKNCREDADGLVAALLSAG